MSSSIPTDFSKEPVSIAELRAAKKENAALWSPRDALIDVLRRIDSGEVSPDALVIAFRTAADEGRHRTHFCVSAPDGYVAAGLFEWGKIRAMGLV